LCCFCHENNRVKLPETGWTTGFSESSKEPVSARYHRTAIMPSSRKAASNFGSGISDAEKSFQNSRLDLPKKLLLEFCSQALHAIGTDSSPERRWFSVGIGLSCVHE
jgi:hypothetical protein